MPNRHQPAALRALLFVMATAILLVALPAAATSDSKRVLVLHSYHQGLGWTDSIARGITETFAASNYQVETFTEYMDTKRIFDKKYLRDLAGLLAYKYRNRKIDVIVSSDDHAFQFLRKHHADLFRDVPVVFCGVNYFKDDFIADSPYFTGVVEAFSIKDTISAALIINPNLQRVYSVVDNTVTGQANLKLLAEIIPDYANRLEFITITDKAMTDVQRDVSRLPPESIVLLLAFTTDRSGNTFSLEQSADLITAASNRPVYSFWDFHLNHGIVGGMLTTGLSQGVAAAELALRIVAGTRPIDIAVVKHSPNQYIFDYAVLSRFGLPVERLPAGSTVINRPRSFYEQHRQLVWHVGLAFGLLLLFTAIVTFNLLEHRATRARLEKSEDKFRSLVETTSDWIWEVDRAGRYVYVSPKIEPLLGYTPEEILGKTPFDLMPPDEAERIGAIFRQLARDKQPLEQIKNINLHKDGREVVLETTGIPVLDDAGELVGYRGIDRDITQRTQAEEERHLLTTAIEHAAESVMITNRDGRVQYVNPSFQRLSGYTLAEIVGENFRILKSGKHDRNFYRDMWQTISHGKVWAGQITNSMKDGSLHQFETRISPVKNRAGEITNFVSVNRDITQEVELAAKLQRSQKMEALGLLAGGVAHDLNNVLSGIVSYPDLLLLDLPPESPLKEPIATIKRSGEKAAEIVQDLLTLARRGVSNRKILNLNDVILDFLKSPEKMKLENQYADIRVETWLAEDLFNIRGSEVHLRKTIMNLFLNAAEAQPSGGNISISTSNQYLDTPIKGYEDIREGDFVVLEIADSGMGIAPEDLERIFEPFYTRKLMGRSGTGLGMAVVWGTVQDHHGYINVESTENRGTTFKLFFPISREKREKDQDEVPIDSYMGSQETILVIDDVKEQREIAATILEKLNYTVATVSSGEAAVAYLQDKSADLLILDMIMDPGIDGLETYKRIIDFKPGQKAIIASGFSETERVKAAQKLGAGAYVKKPYALEKIGLAVRNALQSR